QPMPQRPAPRPMPQRPVAQAPVQAAPIQRPQPLPPRPVAQRPAPRPTQYAQAPQQYAQAPIQPQQDTKQGKAAKPPKIRKARPIWRGFLQVLVSLLVIVGVAAVIVLLYLKYYS
ncbi:MAG: hypothetical protein ABIS59_03540, partial [Candidatus Saccharibacteria bacterium]